MNRIYCLIWWVKEKNKYEQYTTETVEELLDTLERYIEIDMACGEAIIDYQIKIRELPDAIVQEDDDE